MSKIYEQLQPVVSALDDRISEVEERAVTVDSSLSATSTNPVQNKVITETVNEVEDEVEDIRVGYDGTIYQTAGDAVRRQIEEAMQSGGSGGGGYSEESITRDLPWEVGSIDKGVDVPSKARMRNSEFIPFDSDAQEIVFSVLTGYKYSVYLYDEDNNVIKTAPNFDAWMTTDWNMTPPFGGSSFKVILAKTNNANMSDSDIDGILIYKKNSLNLLVEALEQKTSNDALNLTAENYDFGWSQGDISETTGGAIYGNAERWRTEYIRVGAGSIAKFPGATSYGMWVYNYDKNKAFLGHSGKYLTEYSISHDGYIRIMIRIPSSSDIEQRKAAVSVIRKLPNDVFMKAVDDDRDELPAYYNEPIDTAIASVKTNMETAGINGDTFVFFSDTHWPNTVGTLWMVINRILEAIPTIQNVINGGDTINGASDANVSIDAFMQRYIPTHATLYNLIGNHETNVSSAKYYARLLKHLDYKVTAGGIGYYYFDNTVTKTRYICLNTYGQGDTISGAQLAWFNASLDSMPDGYNALVFAHILYNFTRDWHDAAITNHGRAIANACDTFNANNSTKKVFAIFGAHTHVDLEFTTDGGIPMVMIDTSSLLHDGPNTATAGTITETALDIVTVDYTNKTIKCERIGRGESRTITAI